MPREPDYTALRQLQPHCWLFTFERGCTFNSDAFRQYKDKNAAESLLAQAEKSLPQTSASANVIAPRNNTHRSAGISHGSTY